MPSPFAKRVIFHPKYDFLFFFLPPLLFMTTPWMAPMMFPSGVGGWLLVLAFMHEGAMWGIYTDSEWRSVHRKYWIPFLLGPVAMIGIVLALSYFSILNIPGIVMLFFWWNAFHLVRQNVGIYSIYKHRNPASYKNGHDNWAIYFCNFGAFLYGCYLDPVAMPILHKSVIVKYIALGSLGIGSALAAYCIYSIRETLHENFAAVFFMIAVVYYLPFCVWRYGFAIASATALFTHYIQYIALQLGVQTNRSTGGDIKTAVLRMGLFVGVGMVVWVGIRSAFHFGDLSFAGPYEPNLLVAATLFSYWSGLSHFFVDRYVWKMAYPEVRVLAVPFLRPFGATASGTK